MIWLTGAQGMLGSEVAAVLEQNGFPYIATDLEYDLADRERLRDFGSTALPLDTENWIINCAAYTNVDLAETEEDLAFKANASGVKNLSHIATEREAGLVHISTDYVFDGTADIPYDTQVPVSPINVYGVTKAQGESFIREFVDRHIIIRTAWLYGRHGKNFVSTMLRLMAERDSVRVVDDQIGAPTSASDLARAICKILGKLMESKRDNLYGTYHFTNSGSTTWYDVAREIQNRAARLGLISGECIIQPVSTEDYPTAAKRPQYSILDGSTTSKAFGISRRRWQDALQDFLEQGDQ